MGAIVFLSCPRFVFWVLIRRNLRTDLSSVIFRVMKLRIRGNSIRLRLTQSEVEKVGNKDSVEEVTVFPNGKSFAFMVATDENIGNIQADFNNGKIEIFIPQSLAKNWAVTEQVGLYSEHGNIQIAVEKDFKCLTPRAGDEDKDTFPHPKESSYEC